MQVRLTSNTVDCGPILPNKPGLLPNERLLQLVNDGSRPVEVIAVELDGSRLLQDEASLQLLDRC
jgi:hypothetical protein